jgi:hypothetical protein
MDRASSGAVGGKAWEKMEWGQTGMAKAYGSVATAMIQAVSKGLSIQA